MDILKLTVVLLLSKLIERKEEIGWTCPYLRKYSWERYEIISPTPQLSINSRTNWVLRLEVANSLGGGL